MTFYNRVIILGRGMTGEVWSCGLNYNALPGIEDFDQLQAWALAIGNYIEAQATAGIYEIISSSAAITGVRTEYRGPEEQLVQAGEITLTPEKPGSSAPNKVPQASVCFSLLTGRPGRSYRGRIYWPAWIYASTAQMRFTGLNLTQWVGQVIALNTAIEAAAEAAAPESLLELAVRSRLLNTNQPVTQIAAGDVPDVQRRRRDALVEAYTAQALP